MNAADRFLQLADLGLSNTQIAGVLKMFDAEDDVRKAKTRARVDKWRAKNKSETLSNVTERHIALPNVTERLVREGARVEDITSNLEITGNKEERKKEDAPAALSPCQELQTVLDEEHARAVVDHRQRLRKPLTGYAARKLAGLLAKHPDPNAAADKMIESGWLKIEPGWGQPQARGSPNGHRKQTPTEANQILSEYENGYEFEAERDHEVARILPPDRGQLRSLDSVIRGAINPAFPGGR